MPFWTYSQNNSGGVFDYDGDSGISNYVIVEADSAEDADDRAESIGLYFDGEGDCPCCGSRWYAAGYACDSGTETPQVYGDEVAVFKPLFKWLREGKAEVFVHYLDGRVEGYCW